ncbi:hypothetical protein AB0A63_00290 [Lentzea sp. NPDC042327]|uniref:hypothetical protein n=1 Tax=Lentzea sp. NPDC042327 TaxID=3154801 RepID=UPI0033F35D04
MRTKHHFTDVEQEVMIDAIGYLKDSERYREVVSSSTTTRAPPNTTAKFGGRWPTCRESPT